MSVKTDIERLKALSERLLNLGNKLQTKAFGKITPEQIDIANINSPLRGAIFELEQTFTGIETWTMAIKEDPDNDTYKKRLAVDEQNLPKRLKRALKLEKEALTLISEIENKKDEPKEKEKEPEKKPEPKPQPKPTPKPQPKPVPTPKPTPQPKPTPATSANTPEEYIQKLNDLKQKAERSIISALPSIEKVAYQLAVDFFDENLDTKDGKFVANEAALLALNKFTDDYLGAFTKNETFKGAVGGYLKNFRDIATLIDEFQKSNGRDVKQARLGAVQEIVTNEIINRYSENGLNPNFVQPLRQLLFNNITGGLNKKEAMAQLRDYIESGKDASGKLGRYLEQTAQQGVDSYTGAVNTRIMQTFKINTYIQSGSLIATSSPQCRFVLKEWGGIIERKDWPKYEAIAKKHGLIEGTTFDNLPINKGHWACRHEFTPITLSEKQRTKLLKNPVNN